MMLRVGIQPLTSVHLLLLTLQNEVDANRVKLDEMQGQQDMFDHQMAKAALAASDQQTNFNDQMARAVLAASDQQTSFDCRMATAELAASSKQIGFDHHMAKAKMAAGLAELAYEKLACDNADQKKTAAQVCTV